MKGYYSMKKFLCLFLLLIFCINFVSCEECPVQESTTDFQVKEVNAVYDKHGNLLQRTVYNELTDEYTLTKFTYKYVNGFWECTDQSVITYRGSVDSEAAPVINPNLVIYYKQDLENNPIVILDNADIKISITKYLTSDNWWEFGYELEIVNKTTRVFTITIDTSSIMGVQCDPMFSVEHVSGETTATFILGWDKDTMQRCYVPYIDNVEFMLRVFKNENWTVPALYGARLMIKN